LGTRSSKASRHRELRADDFQFGAGINRLQRKNCGIKEKYREVLQRRVCSYGQGRWFRKSICGRAADESQAPSHSFARAVLHMNASKYLVDYISYLRPLRDPQYIYIYPLGPLLIYAPSHSYGRAVLRTNASKYLGNSQKRYSRSCRLDLSAGGQGSATVIPVTPVEAEPTVSCLQKMRDSWLQQKEQNLVNYERNRLETWMVLPTTKTKRVKVIMGTANIFCRMQHAYCLCARTKES
jgi:hypothetical protein